MSVLSPPSGVSAVVDGGLLSLFLPIITSSAGVRTSTVASLPVITAAHTVTVTKTTTVLQLVYFPTAAAASTLNHPSASASNVQEALDKVANQYEGLTLSEIGSLAGIVLLGIIIGSIVFMCTVNYARRARNMVEGGGEDAWGEMPSWRKDAEAQRRLRLSADASSLGASAAPAPAPEGDGPTLAAIAAVGAIVAAAGKNASASASSPETSKDTASRTGTATAAWATQTSGGMQQVSDEQNTIVLHSDASLSYGCPKSGDSWQQESLTDSLTAHTATGPGCWMRYTFQGDSVQVYGASGLQAGVFGCSVNAGPTNASGWWNAYGSSNFYAPYRGSCKIQGLGYDKHTIQLTNSPYQPKKVYFTGLRFTTNESQPIWQSLKWEACCQQFTFPDGVATTVPASSATGVASDGDLLAGLDGSTFSFIIAAIAAVVIAAAALIAILCCKPRKASGSDSLQQLLGGDDSEQNDKEPLRPRHRRGSRHRKPPPSPSPTTTDTTTSSEDGDPPIPASGSSKKQQ
ncbi:hypothetical protein JCM10908_005836 [Rhodotorula pacifica]|uniref:uncharacterized protein n=1 Tax=Rhodotorula pacifica TaxID=1495444 RepID=UPI0031813919